VSLVLPETGFDTRHELPADIEIVLVVQLSDARQTGDIDFCQIFTDYIESGEQYAHLAQYRRDLAANP
jgi:hypothetical protein